MREKVGVEVGENAKVAELVADAVGVGVGVIVAVGEKVDVFCGV